MNEKMLVLMVVSAIANVCFGQDNREEIKQTPPAVTIKTNLLYDATTTLNLGAEFRLGDKTSFDIPLNWNPFSFSENRKWKHFLVQPELRYWTKETFSGHFFGLHTHYSYYNMGRLPKPFSTNMRENRYEGWAVGTGLSYGYRWNFNRNWGMEATVGVGYAYLDYDKFPCGKCGAKTKSDTRHYFGPTKAGLSLIYTFGKKKTAAPAPVYVPPVVAPEPEPEVIIPYLPQLAASYIVPEVEAVKTRKEEGKAYLDFAAGKSDIVSGFKDNSAELQKIYNLIESVKNDPDATITGISIIGYASPEGTYASNLTLSTKRADALKRHVRAMYGFPESFFMTGGKGEDWQTLDSLIAQSYMDNKYEALEIIRGTDVFDGRERKLMELAGGNPYRQMKAELFPRLRRSEYQLHYTVNPFTVEQGKEVFRTKPSSLSLNEMFLIANTYEPGSEAFNEVFETAARIFPDSDVANLNAAVNALNRKDGVSAERYLSKVRKHNAAYYNNMGVLHGLQGEYEKAAEAFERAEAAGSSQAVDNQREIRKAHGTK